VRTTALTAAVAPWLRRRLRLPAPATVVAGVALVVALGGTAYAAGVLPVGSVGTVQLRDNAVVSSKVKNGSLLARDFKAGQLPRGPVGAAGAQGPAGPVGSTGSTGATGATGRRVRVGARARPVESGA
jgi:hypothetical protein